MDIEALFKNFIRECEKYFDKNVFNREIISGNHCHILLCFIN